VAENVLNAVLAVVWTGFGWYAVGRVLSQTKRYGDLVEILIELEGEHFEEARLLERRFAQPQRGLTARELQRFRVEGNTHRITWTDEIKTIGEEGRPWWKIWGRTERREHVRQVFVTLEYK